METKTIKISEANYRSICRYAGQLQKELGEQVSVDRVITVLLKKSKLSDLAGSWKMDDKEADNMIKEIRGGWKSWKTRSA